VHDDNNNDIDKNDNNNDDDNNKCSSRAERRWKKSSQVLGPIEFCDDEASTTDRKPRPTRPFNRTTSRTTLTSTIMSNQPGRTDWAEDDEPDLAAALPAPQHTKNKDGSETIVTIFLNDQGKKVKRTQRIRTVVKRKYERPGVAERRAWPKMGIEAGRPSGPQADTTTLGENIIFRPQVGFKSGAAEQPTAEEDQKAQQLKQMKIKCRICSGEHFTTKCPFKDTMAPEGEAGAGLADLDGDVGAATLQNLAAGGAQSAGPGPAGGSSYVPPHMRKGGAATGERMGGKFERDDLATLRVTNVSFCPFYHLFCS
jgi:translation initiation factor 3 subunit G